VLRREGGARALELVQRPPVLAQVLAQRLRGGVVLAQQLHRKGSRAAGLEPVQESLLLLGSRVL